uniref:Nonstructural protein n=1 Tax=parvo-like hybrid virus TaxID=3367306 RepID=A0AB74UDS5_9VIRU
MKTGNGTDDSTFKTKRTLLDCLLGSETNGIEESLSTSLSEASRLAPEAIRTTTRSSTYTSQQSSTIEFRNDQSLRIGTSKKETVTIWCRGTEISLTPDGKITISRSSPKWTQGDYVCMKWGSCRKISSVKRVEEGEEEKRLKVDEILVIMKNMLEEGKDDECFERFPKNYLQWGEKLKSTLKQRRVTACHEGNPHLWVTGYPGTGKTAILAFIYPKAYKKNLYNRFFDLYDPKEHTHIMMEDLDHEAVEKLSINFIKTICDEAGFSIDQKYKTPQLARTTVLVTSNFDIVSIVPEGNGFNQNVVAIGRRFWQIKIYELLRLVQLKLVPKNVQSELKKSGNTDMSRLFMDWDYLTDSPTGKPIKTPHEYQQIIRDYFFALTS